MKKEKWYKYPIFLALVITLFVFVIALTLYHYGTVPIKQEENWQCVEWKNETKVIRIGTVSYRPDFSEIGGLIAETICDRIEFLEPKSDKCIFRYQEDVVEENRKSIDCPIFCYNNSKVCVREGLNCNFDKCDIIKKSSSGKYWCLGYYENKTLEYGFKIVCEKYRDVSE